MDKIIGFSLTLVPEQAIAPPWLSVYPWLKVWHTTENGWNICFWGHGDLTKFKTPHGYVVGYSNTELDTLSIAPLQNRGLVINLSLNEATITNDAFGMLQVFYGNKGGEKPYDSTPHVSTCEEAVMMGLGSVSLSRGRLVNFLMYRISIGTLTLWREVDKLYANSILTIDRNGNTTQREQPPLQFRLIRPEDVVPVMISLHERVIRRYTDQLGDVYLPLSSGLDSRILLANMQRHPRIHARTYSSSWPYERSQEILIARASAKRVEVEHRILDFVGRTYAQYCRPYLEYLGTAATNLQAYIYGAAQMIGSEGHRTWPVISGVCGDIVSGVGTNHVLQRLLRPRSPHQHFKMACHCEGTPSWRAKQLNAGLTYDWESCEHCTQHMWADMWKTRECDDLTASCALIRLRNRGSQLVTASWATTDLWNGYVTPYLDREYVVTMLSMPVEARQNRIGQRKYASQRFPAIFPNAGVPASAYDVSNTLNATSICNEALWPLVADGSKPAHPYFNPAGIESMYQRALEGHLPSFYQLRSLQPIAWAIEKGYVK